MVGKVKSNLDAYISTTDPIKEKRFLANALKGIAGIAILAVSINVAGNLYFQK